jgi:hypothetical protein
MTPRVFRSSLIVGAIVLSCLAVPGVAAATVTVTSYKITSNLPAFPTEPSGGPSSAQAAAVVDAGSYSTFGYSSPSEDIQTALTNFAPGLLGNPESVPKCPEASLQPPSFGATCPAGSQIGTSRLDVKLASGGGPFTSFSGVVYNAEPLGDEPGRLGVVTAAAGLVSSIPFRITPRGNGDYGLTGTLTDIAQLDAVQLGPPLFIRDLQVHALSFVLNGATNNYVRNPTSCATHNNTGQAAGYEDTSFTDGPAYKFGTTGCDTVPFKPTTTLELGDAGNTAFNRHAPFKLTITQAPGSADIKGNKITLPVELNTNNPVYKLCTQAQADADNCPADSKFGGAAAKSPFLAEEVKGPVYLIQQTNTSLPGLLIDLRGRVHVKIQTKTTLVNNKAIQSLVLNSPQLPISEFRIGLNGGKNGVFLNRQDLCFRGNTGSKFNDVSGLIKDYGHNGTTTSETKLKAKVNGCGPGVDGSISGATGSRPSVRINVPKHPDAPNYKELTVTLSTNLSLVKSRFGSGASVSAGDVEYTGKRSFKVTGLPAAGEDTVTIRLRSGAVRVSDRSRSLLRRGRTRTFRAKVKQAPVSGKATSTKGSFKARGR